MKTRLSLLSLIGNVVLLATLLVMVSHRRPPEKKEIAAAAPVAPVQHPLMAPAAPLTAKNVGQLIPQLRAANVSESLLARLAADDFEERWDKLRDEMQAKYDNGDITVQELDRFNESHDAEEEKELRAALGNDGYVAWDKKNRLAEMARLNLSPAESDAAYRLKKELQQAQLELNRKLRDGEIDDADYNEQLAKAQTQYESRMKDTLGEDRFVAWQNPDDGARGDLKRNLRALNASDDQFTALLEAQHAWNQQRAALERKYADGLSEDDYNAKLKSLDAARDNQYQQVLGTNGVAMLERQQDNNYQTLKRYETTWNLTDADVDHLYASLHDYQKTVDDYRRRAQTLEESGQDVDWAAVDENIRQFGHQIEQGLEIYLGKDRFSKIRRNNIFNFSSSGD